MDEVRSIGVPDVHLLYTLEACYAVAESASFVHL